MNRQYTLGGGALGFVCFATTAVLFILKVSGTIDASWWLVLAPLGVYFGLFVLAVVLIVLVWIAIALFAVVIHFVEQHEIKAGEKKRQEMLTKRRNFK